MPITRSLVTGPSGEPPVVMACSIGGRLPYADKNEPSKATVMRHGLVKALSQLEAGEDQLLHATLISPRSPGETTDTENVLLFNFSSGRALAPSCAKGLRFERVDAPPAAPSLPGAEHQHRYELAQLDEGFRHHDLGAPIAGFDWIEVPKWTETEGAYPSQIWWRVRHATKPMGVVEATAAPRVFGLRLRLRANRRHAGGLIKKATDAAIAAHQVHVGPLDPRLPPVLEQQLGVPAAEAAALLKDPATAVLGAGSLAHPWGRTLQWTPADHLLVAFEILLEHIPVGVPWQMRGELYRVTALGPDRRAG